MCSSLFCIFGEHFAAGFVLAPLTESEVFWLQGKSLLLGHSFNEEPSFSLRVSGTLKWLKWRGVFLVAPRLRLVPKNPYK